MGGAAINLAKNKIKKSSPKFYFQAGNFIFRLESF
jgi:hypothetical protein